MAMTRNDRIRARREECASLRALAGEFGLSVARIVEILEATGGDPLHDADPAVMTTFMLTIERDRLARRIADERRKLRILGLAD